MLLLLKTPSGKQSNLGVTNDWFSQRGKNSTFPLNFIKTRHKISKFIYFYSKYTYVHIDSQLKALYRKLLCGNTFVVFIRIECSFTWETLNISNGGQKKKKNKYKTGVTENDMQIWEIFLF